MDRRTDGSSQFLNFCSLTTQLIAQPSSNLPPILNSQFDFNFHFSFFNSHFSKLQFSFLQTSILISQFSIPISQFSILHFSIFNSPNFNSHFSIFNSPNFNSQFSKLQFSFLNSQFSIPNSQFSILHFSFLISPNFNSHFSIQFSISHFSFLISHFSFLNSPFLNSPNFNSHFSIFNSHFSILQTSIPISQFSILQISKFPSQQVLRDYRAQPLNGVEISPQPKIQNVKNLPNAPRKSSLLSPTACECPQNPSKSKIRCEIPKKSAPPSKSTEIRKSCSTTALNPLNCPQSPVFKPLLPQFSILHIQNFHHKSCCPLPAARMNK